MIKTLIIVKPNDSKITGVQLVDKFAINVLNMFLIISLLGN